VPLGALVGGADDPSVVEASLAAAERGFGTIKVKLAGPLLAAQLETLAAVRQAIGSRSLRLDANQSLDASTAKAELAALVGLTPELVEEPVSPEALLSASFTSPVPIALDESLQNPGMFARLAPELARLRCVAVVLKPMVLGGFGACVRLAGEASAAGLDVTVSHLFDGPVALAASAHLALVVGSRTRASGLARHGGLAGWPGVYVGREPTTLVAGAFPGLGIGPLPAPA
jgi:L-alanine-DL-glutamate epimerase-like enolase superfamily enzyme